MKIEITCPHCGKCCAVEPCQQVREVACPGCGRILSLDAGPLPLPTPPLPSESQHGADERLPGQIGRFRIRRRLGAGAYGIVYLADDPVLERQVALKVMQRQSPGGGAARTRFLREAKAAARLNHPQIVPVFDAGQAGDRLFIASAYVAGGTLEEEIEAGIPSPRRTAWICQQLAEAMHYAHQSGVVHRDVKSSNVMVDPAGDVYLMDFGLAQVHGSDEGLTRDDAVLGTAAYMAPEQASRQFGTVGPQSDQYGLGVVLYELLCGQVPFSGLPAVVLYNVIETDPVPPRHIASTVPRDLETICLKAMAKRAEERYVDCAALADDLRRWLAGEVISARRAGPVERLVRWSQRNPIVASLVAIVATLLLLTGIVPSVGYGVVAQRVAQRERDEGTKEELVRDIVRSKQELKELGPQIAKLKSRQVALEQKWATLDETRRDMQNERDQLREQDPIDVIVDELRQIVDSADEKPVPDLPSKPARPPVALPAAAPSPAVPGSLLMGQADAIAARVPENCIYASLADTQTLLRAVNELSENWTASNGPNPMRSELNRLQTQLCLPELPSDFEFSNRMVADVALISRNPSDPLAEVGIIVQAANGASSRQIGESIRWQRSTQFTGVAAELTIPVDGHAVSLIVSKDGTGRVHSFYVAAGDLHLITNSLALVTGFLRTGRGGKSISSTADFAIAAQMVRQASKPQAVILVPCVSGNPPGNTHNLGHMVCLISQIASLPDDLRTLSFDISVPSPWIGFLVATALGAEYQPLDRIPEQHLSRSRIAPVPGDALFLEIAMTDTSRIFGALRDGGTYYLGIAESVAFSESLRKLTPQLSLDSLTPFVADAVDRVCDQEGLDAQGYGEFTFPFLGSGWRRVFNEDWAAFSPEKTVVEDVTPNLKMEAAKRPATIRLRISETQPVADGLNAILKHDPFPILAVVARALESIAALELNLAPGNQRVLAFGKIDWIRPPESQPQRLVGQSPDWQRLEMLRGMRRDPALKQFVEKAILLSSDRLGEQTVAAAGVDASRDQALAELFELETALFSLETVAYNSTLQRIQQQKTILLDQLIAELDQSLSGREKWSAILKKLTGVSPEDRAVRQRFVDEMLQAMEWVARLDASPQSAQDLKEVENRLIQSGPGLDSVRNRIETKQIELIKTRAHSVIEDLSLGRSQTHLGLTKLLPLLPASDRGKQAKEAILAEFYSRYRQLDD